MKKIFLFIMIGACFYSCSKDSPSPIQNNDQIVGKWKIIKEIEIDSFPPYSWNGQHFDSQIISYDTIFYKAGSYIHFSRDEKVYIKESFTDGQENFTSNDTALYKIVQNNLEIRSLPNSADMDAPWLEKYEIRSLTDTDMVLYYNEFTPSDSSKDSYYPAVYNEGWAYLQK